MSLKSIKVLFLVAAIYDIVLGIVFGLWFKPIYAGFGAELPNNVGYIQLIALFVFIFGTGFYLVYRNPEQNRDISIIGVLMKLSFAVVVFGNLAFSTIPLPQIFITLAALDLLFVPFFVVAYGALNKMASKRLSSNPQRNQING